MGNRPRTACFLLGLLLLNPGGFAQDAESAWGDQRGSIPDELRRPERGEAPRYPTDVVIGELGQGKSPDGAYNFAKNLLSILISGSKDAEIIKASAYILTESLLKEINSLRPRSYRIGGGRVEADGSVSFMVRFLGPDQSITGELYVRQVDSPVIHNEEVSAENNVSEEEVQPVWSYLRANAADLPVEGKWLLDDLILEDKRDITDIRDSYRYDFSPYERFY